MGGISMENIYEAIELHNRTVDKMQDLAATLLKEYPGVEETPVNDAFVDAWNEMTGMAIWICCEAAAVDGGGWVTTGDWHVLREEDVEG